MSILKKILKEDPNWIRDDDHLDRKDMTKKEFSQFAEELKAKHGVKNEKDKRAK